MNKLFVTLLLLLAFAKGTTQIVKPVKWTSKVEKLSDTEFNLVMVGKIDADWHMYSQYTPDGGPLSAVFTFDKAEGNYELVGKTKESPYKKHFNDVFGVDEYYFETKVTFTQKVKVTNPKLTSIKGGIDYQVCKQVCINDTKQFTFALPTMTATAAATPEVVTADTAAVVASAPVKDTTVKATAAVTKAVVSAPKKEEKKGLWSIFLFAFFGGMLATITPCVFPMIPMTVSFFLKQSKNKSKGRFNALFYGLCIVVICVLITIPFHLLEGIDRGIFSNISTNVYLNLFFFVIFVVFAISFFGAFEITIPNKFANKVDNASNTGGMLGIFFMALTLIIVSFSCIGPALGFVFGTSLNSDGGATILSLAMFGFGLGLALPFMFFALAPNLLGNLPKSGGWLNTVKVVFGFIELALAFKFLSNADLVLQVHYLEREIFIAIWIAIFGIMALYLFGKITLPHDSPMSHISVGRMLFGLVTLAFTIYLIPGLWGAPLKIVSAFTPPQTYSESPVGIGGVAAAGNADPQQLPKGAALGPHGIISFEDYATGLAYAKEINKPVLIDFTGRACQNCRLMESNVWTDEKVLSILKNDIVLISLYCDDRTELPKSEQYVSKESGNVISTIGQKWSEFQILRFKNNARPYYVLLDLNENQLNTPVPYTPDIATYLEWLKEGVAKFKK